MKAAIKKWGNSAAIRLPARILASVHIEIDTEVEITQKQGCIVISPITQHYHLDTLLNAITPSNCHDEIDTDNPIGKEAW
jgi:antitoxin MazE